jgi:hypothetical protein
MTSKLETIKLQLIKQQVIDFCTEANHAAGSEELLSTVVEIQAELPIKRVAMKSVWLLNIIGRKAYRS